MSYHEGFRIGRWNRVSIGNHTLKDGHSSPPLIFTSALMAIEANTTSRKSQTMATDTAITKSTAVPPAVSTPSESTCIPTTFPVSSNTMLETDSREETIPLQRQSKLGNLQSSQTYSPVPIIRAHVLIAQKDVPVEISKTQNIRPDQSRYSYKIHYSTVLKLRDNELPLFTKIHIEPTGTVDNPQFQSAYGAVHLNLSNSKFYAQSCLSDT